MSRFAIHGAWFIAFVFITVFFIPAFSAADELKWTGCDVTKKAFMDALAEAYEKKTGIKVTLTGGGATRGIRDVAAGKADIGGTCRHTIDVPEEKNVNLVHVAWDAIVTIVHPSNPVSSISTSNLKDIFLGKITNWKEVGGPDIEIMVVETKGKTGGVELMTRELLFQNTDQDFTPKAIQLQSSGLVEKTVEQEKAAIGVTGISSATKRNVKILNIDGKSPNKENIIKSSYPFFRPIYLVTSNAPSEGVKKFIKFALSAEGQEVITKEGTVSLKEGSRLMSLYKGRMK